MWLHGSFSLFCIKLSEIFFDLLQVNQVKRYVKVFSYVQTLSLAKKYEICLTGDHPWKTYHYVVGVATCITMIVTTMSGKLDFTSHTKFQFDSK